MQVLWSRAAPSRSACRCRACFRQTTTAVSKRRLKVGDLFTACYSTILGTAVFADAKAKEERRKEWDRAIAEVKAGTPMDAPDRVERMLTDQGHVGDLLPVVRAILGDTSKRANAPIRDGMSLTSSPSIHLDPVDLTLDLHVKQAISKSHRIQHQTISSETEEDWPNVADAPDKICESAANLFEPREPADQIHVDKMEEMVSKLVSTLLLRRRQLSTLADTTSSDDDISLRLKEIAGRIESLQGDTRLPSYSFYDHRKSAIERWRLNSALEKLFENMAADQSNIDLILAKICYNLLVSTSPPNIKTYNVLIRSFNRFKIYELSQVVIDSFLFQSKFKPNPETIRLILDHYSKQKDKLGFKAMVNRMRAVDGDMRMRTREVGDMSRWHVQEWATTRKVILKKGLLREKVPRDSTIFDSLINGFLELDMVRAAMCYLRAALREGMHVSSSTLLRLVQTCASTLDYKTGLSVLRLLLGYCQRSSEQVVYNSQARLAVHQLFGLCGINPSLDSTTQLPHGVSQTALQNLQRHMAMQSLEDAMDHFAARLMKVRDLLVNSNDSEAQSTRSKNEFVNRNIKKALSLLYAASRDAHRRSLKKDANNNRAATMRNTNTLHTISIATQYSKLPTEWQQTYDGVIKCNSNLSWSERHKIMSYFQQGKQLPQEHPLYLATLSQWNRNKRRLTMWPKSATGTGWELTVADEEKCLEPRPPGNWREISEEVEALRRRILLQEKYLDEGPSDTWQEIKDGVAALEVTLSAREKSVRRKTKIGWEIKEHIAAFKRKIAFNENSVNQEASNVQPPSQSKESPTEAPRRITVAPLNSFPPRTPPALYITHAPTQNNSRLEAHAG